jgi:hypothetical protein
MDHSKFKDNQDSKTCYKVFVSSTYLDNKERRKLVQDAITTAGMIWHGMEIFTASTHPTVDMCIKYAKEADLLVGIIGHRYGWEPYGKKSITEMEYDVAKERLMFQIDPLVPVIPDIDFDKGSDRWDKQKKLDAFKKKFSKDQMPTYFTENTLQAKVLHALKEWKQNHKSNSRKELDSYNKEDSYNTQILINNSNIGNIANITKGSGDIHQSSNNCYYIGNKGW